METTILILCVALVLVVGVALICETVRLVGGYRALKEEREKDGREQPSLVLVKQDQGEVRIAYLLFKAEEKPEEAPAEEATLPAAEEMSAEEEVAAAQEEESDRERLMAIPEGGVVLAKAKKQTFAEKYEELSEESRAFLDEFAAYVTDKEDCTKLLQTSALSFRYKKSLIAKAVIRRDVVVLNFTIANPELGRMMREEHTKSIRMQPVEIRLLSESDLGLAKQTADMTIGYLCSEEMYRLEKRREARREAERMRRAEAAAASNQNEEDVAQ